MKKLLIISLLVICGISAKAQIVYQPFIPKSNPVPTYTPPSYIPRPTIRPSAPSATKISEQSVMTAVYDLKKDAVYDAQVKITTWSDGDKFLTLVGLKPDGKWELVKLEIFPIISLLENSELDTDAKEFLLTCNEVAEFIVFSDDNIFLTGIRQK